MVPLPYCRQFSNGRPANPALRRWSTVLPARRKRQGRNQVLNNDGMTAKTMGGIVSAIPPIYETNSVYGVSLLIRVDQLPSAARTPGPWLAPPHVPRRLSPVPPTKKGPPQLV